MNPKLLGERIATLRHKRGLSQRQLGKRARTHGNTISLIERGRYQKLSTLAKVAKALDVELYELFKPERRK